MSTLTLLRATLKAAGYRHLRTLGYAALYETLSRRAAFIKYTSKGNSTIWDMVGTTKEVK